MSEAALTALDLPALVFKREIDREDLGPWSSATLQLQRARSGGTCRQVSGSGPAILLSRASFLHLYLRFPLYSTLRAVDFFHPFYWVFSHHFGL